jgi:tetratricopeptide (TPR) repeat protein
MRNKNRPFFYDDRKSKWPRFAVILILIIVAVIWGARVPAIRQALSQPILETISYGWSLLRPPSAVNPLDYRIQTFYPTVELPSREVIFAENLDQISQMEFSQDIVITPTPTPGLEWYIEDSSHGAASQLLTDGERSHQIKLPEIELQDFQNDGSVCLSAILRYYGYQENQYTVGMHLKPDYFDPNISINEMSLDIASRYPDLAAAIRLNGDEALLTALVQADIPVLLRLQTKRSRPAWQGDDLWDARYFILTGYDLDREVFLLADPESGKQKEISIAAFMADWYPFQRQLLVLYPAEQEAQISAIFGSSWSESENLRAALEKFQMDVTMVPENQFAWLNAGEALLADNQTEAAWNSMRTAFQIGIPQRYLLYQFAPYEAAFQIGAADELRDRTAAALARNQHSEENWLWNGWAWLLASQLEQTERSFKKANEINPGNPDVQYALEFLRQY